MSQLIDVNNFDPVLIKNYSVLPFPSGNRGSRRKVKFLDCVCAFDIETTRLEDIEQAIMYVWQFQISTDYTIIGRTWDQFLLFLQGLNKNMPENVQLMIFVHNLSYEFTFLKGVYPFKPEEVFAMDNRKVLRCSMYGRFEFRCSYLQSNMSLAMFTEKMNVKHKKLDDFVYTEKRFPWSELQPRELEYMQNDVLGLVECIIAEMDRDGDTLYKLPLTSTGYVRRDVKKAMRNIPHAYIMSIQPDKELYEMLRDAFRGGNTHANRYYVTSDNAQNILNNVKSADRSSSYPDVICNCPFPVKPFFKAHDVSFETLQRLIHHFKKPIVCRCSLEDIRLKNEYWGCPYLAKAKCTGIINGAFDNGRILSADYLVTTITDIDFQILESEYDFILTPYNIYYSSYGMLPACIRNVVIDYYKCKTELKGVEGQEAFYLKSKNLLNSIYGMMATDPVKLSIIYDRTQTVNEFITQAEQEVQQDLKDGKIIDNIYEEMHCIEDRLISEAIEANRKQAFISYAWGVWVTAWARLRLEEGIRLAGESFVYADTDSVKYIGDVDFSKFNEDRQLDSIRNGAFATDPNGITHYMGVYEDDGIYKRFATMGAKKYVYEEVNKKGETELHITIAGVAKAAGAAELTKHGGIEAFKTGFLFKEAGGLEAVYNDHPGIKEIQIDGHTLPITSNVVLRPSTYTLGITGEYDFLLKGLPKIKFDKILNKVYYNNAQI